MVLCRSELRAPLGIRFDDADRGFDTRVHS
jgi:hypothetical protein